MANFASRASAYSAVRIAMAHPYRIKRSPALTAQNDPMHERKSLKEGKRRESEEITYSHYEALAPKRCGALWSSSAYPEREVGITARTFLPAVRLYLLCHPLLLINRTSQHPPLQAIHTLIRLSDHFFFQRSQCNTGTKDNNLVGHIAASRTTVTRHSSNCFIRHMISRGHAF